MPALAGLICPTPIVGLVPVLYPRLAAWMSPFQHCNRSGTSLHGLHATIGPNICPEPRSGSSNGATGDWYWEATNRREIIARGLAATETLARADAMGAALSHVDPRPENLPPYLEDPLPPLPRFGAALETDSGPHSGPRPSGQPPACGTAPRYSRAPRPGSETGLAPARSNPP